LSFLPLTNVFLSCLEFIYEGTFQLRTEHLIWTVDKICGEWIKGLRKKLTKKETKERVKGYMNQRKKGRNERRKERRKNRINSVV
jgi:hypothetical protein